MLRFNKEDTTAELILTLTELTTINAAYYLFVFTHVTTREQVIFLRSAASDESGYPERYNQYTINPSVVFADKPVGEWHYKVQEQASNSNLDPAASGAVVEYGKLRIETPGLQFTQYEGSTSYKAYNG